MKSPHLLTTFIALSLTLSSHGNSWGFSAGGISYNTNQNGCQRGRAGGFIAYSPAYPIYYTAPVIYMQPYQNWRTGGYQAYPNYQAYPPMGYLPRIQSGGYYCR